jgi:hypothetical protein
MKLRATILFAFVSVSTLAPVTSLAQFPPQIKNIIVIV